MKVYTKLTAKTAKEVKAKLLEAQGYVCPLYRTDMRSMPSRNQCLDHDHETGAIRAVLCRNCNGIEGRILNLAKRASRGSMPQVWLTRLLRYLEQHKVNQTGYLHPSWKDPKVVKAMAKLKREPKPFKIKGGKSC